MHNLVDKKDNVKRLQKTKKNADKSTIQVAILR